MHQMNPNLYEVSTGEVVTVTFTGTGVNSALATFAVDTPFTNPGPVQFVFPVSKAPGQRHDGAFHCPFPPGSPANAAYDVRVAGSQGGSFNGPHVTAAGITNQPLMFDVV